MESADVKRYHVSLHRAKGCYFACVTELPGCVTRGASEVEALENARAAIRAHQWIARVLAAEQATLRLEIRA
jgi:predicted RNase H-like HicB family nuclease